MLLYFLLYKPYGVLSQFTQEVAGQRTLKTLRDFPAGVYPVGRLDKDSEGLLLLTNDQKVNHQLLNPKFEHARTYLVQVEGIPDRKALASLQNGITIKINKKSFHTAPARVVLLDEAPKLPDRDPPVRYRKTVPDRWLAMTLTEGKNRQVRKMCAAVGHPVLRLVRWSIEQLTAADMVAGEVRAISARTFYQKLNLKK